MKLIRLLLVDDESLVLNAMKFCVEQSDMGYEVFTASNGCQALELSRALHPQVVISDVEMPNMDGLTFLQQLKQITPGSLIYVLSGYQNFEYAKRAIDLGVRKYLIKPLEEQLLLNLLSEARQTLEYDHVLLEEKRSRHKLACKSLLSDFFTLSMNEINIPSEMVKQLSCLLPHGPYMLMFLQLEDRTDSSSNNELSVKGSTPTFFNLEKQIAEVLDPCHTDSILTLSRTNEYILLIVVNAENALQSGIELSKKVCMEIAASLDVRLVAGVSPPVEQASLLSDACRQCMCALANEQLTPEALLLTYKPGLGYGEALEQISVLIECLERQSYQNLQHQIRLLYDTLSADDFSVQKSIKISEALLHTILDKLMTYQPHQPIKQPSLSSYGSLYHMRELVLRQAAALCEYDSSSVSKTETLISKAQKYISENLNDVSLSKVSEAVGCTPIYLSTVFKNSTGIKFIDYITRMKIDAARMMLADSSIKIHDIADQLGYMDSKYFSQIFKKNVGITPNEYRMALENKSKTW